MQEFRVGETLIINNMFYYIWHLVVLFAFYISLFFFPFELSRLPSPFFNLIFLKIILFSAFKPLFASISNEPYLNLLFLFLFYYFLLIYFMGVFSFLSSINSNSYNKPDYKFTNNFEAKKENINYYKFKRWCFK